MPLSAAEDYRPKEECHDGNLGLHIFMILDGFVSEQGQVGEKK